MAAEEPAKPVREATEVVPSVRDATVLDPSVAVPESPPRRGPWALFEIFTVVLVGLLGLILRLHNDGKAPAFTDNVDELQFTWAGMNMFLHGDAYTWSFYPPYPNGLVTHGYGDVEFTLVHHWMDHPPLFSLIMGGWALLNGIRDMWTIQPEQIRTVPVTMSALTVVLVFILARRLLGFAPAAITAGLLAIAPAAILLGRQAEPESVQGVLLLACLIFCLYETEGRGKAWSRGLLLLFCVAAPLMKVSGAAVGGICAVILIATGSLGLGLACAGAALGGLGLFALYGWMIDWNLFKEIWNTQAANRTSVMGGFEFLTSSAGANRQLRDGWWILGLIGLAMLIVVPTTRGDRRRELFLVWPVFAYSAVMLIMAGEAMAHQYGWYKVIIYPEVYAGAGWLIWEAVRRSSMALMTLVLVLGGATATNWWLGGLDSTWVPNPTVLVVLFGIVLAPAVLVWWGRWRREQVRQVGWVVAGLALAAIAIGNMTESYWLERIFWRL